jgi:hypothetical protein
MANASLRISVIVNSDFADGERARVGFARSEILSVSVHDEQEN